MAFSSADVDAVRRAWGFRRLTGRADLQACGTMKALLVAAVGLAGSLGAEVNLEKSFSEPFAMMPSLSLHEISKLGTPAPKIAPVSALPRIDGRHELKGMRIASAVPAADKFVHAPAPGIDYKLIVKAPDKGIDYKLVVKEVVPALVAEK